MSFIFLLFVTFSWMLCWWLSSCLSDESDNRNHFNPLLSVSPLPFPSVLLFVLPPGRELEPGTPHHTVISITVSTHPIKSFKVSPFSFACWDFSFCFYRSTKNKQLNKPQGSDGGSIMWKATITFTTTYVFIDQMVCQAFELTWRPQPKNI